MSTFLRLHGMISNAKATNGKQIGNIPVDVLLPMTCIISLGVVPTVDPKDSTKVERLSLLIAAVQDRSFVVATLTDPGDAAKLAAFNGFVKDAIDRASAATEVADIQVTQF